MKLLAKIGLCGLLAGGTGTVLYADPTGGWLSPNGVAGGASSSTTLRTDSVGVTTLSSVDAQARVHQMHEQTRTDSRHVQYLQQMARKDKNVLKLNCVNDKLVQMKPEMNLADQAESELASAGESTRMAAFDRVAMAAENCRRLREEADQCIGDPILQTGGLSSNSFTGPHAPDDPTKGFSRTQLEPPIYASPFN
jgi:hypothetical protein